MKLKGPWRPKVPKRRKKERNNNNNKEKNKRISVKSEDMQQGSWLEDMQQEEHQDLRPWCIFLKPWEEDLG